MGILTTIKTCWRHRALIEALVARQLNARYRGSILGFLWTFLNPIFLMLIYALVFRVYMRFDMDHYPAFVFAGLLPWIWFTTSMSEGANSLVANGNLITRAMFPPEILPVVAVTANLVNFVFTIPVLLAVFLISGIPFGWQLAWLPVIVAIQCIFTLALTFLFAALNVPFRDVQHLLTNALTFWFFLCPILYPLERVPAALKPVALGNGMGTLITSYQNIFVHQQGPGMAGLFAMLFGSILLLFLGDAVFRHYRDTFAEYL